MSDPLDLPNRHYVSGYGRGIEDQKLELDTLLARCIGVLRLPLIFHAGGEVTVTMRTHWFNMTGSHEMTNKVMCDTIRDTMQEIERARTETTRVLERGRERGYGPRGDWVSKRK